jgi:tRNA(Ile)-lysidine synthase
MNIFNELNSRIISYINKYGLFGNNDKVLIAVSGGMDSMFLLQSMIEIKSVLNIDLAIGHINHNIRDNSDRDEKFVFEQGNELGIPVHIKKLKFSNKLNTENTESWARENRYEKLEVIRDEIGFDMIATGHHKNDQIETILQRISEKSGMSGLMGIHKQIGNVIRPLLSISKKEIERVVKENNINYIEDETNQDIKLKRNYFRHQVIPRWEELIPNLGESFQSISESAEKTESILNYFYSELKKQIVNIDESIFKIDSIQFEELPINVKISFFGYLLNRKSWRRHHWNELNKIISNAKLGKIYQIENNEIIKDRNEWVIRHKLKDIQKPIEINIDDSIEYGDIIISIKSVDKAVIDENPNREFVDKNKIENKKLVIRKWRKGDGFLPIGMIGTKKVSDYLTDQKVSVLDKEKQLVITADDELIWLCGYRLSDSVKIDKNTKQYLELSILSNVG